MEEKENIIYFYDSENDYVKKEHIFLNNFEPSPFKADDDFTYQSVEHYYQCHKFDNFEEHPEFRAAFEEIRNASDPLKSKKAARKYQDEFKGKWNNKRWEDGYKDTIMRRGLVFKFEQNRNMIEFLLGTGSAKLVERSEKDPYWGGLLPKSLNKLGNFLMELRDNIKNEKSIYLTSSELDKIYIEK